ncbi:MAG: hypothetical protein BGO78_15735 [Chloroflexi bacterium 44-23]|nr:MAG: hypothetical protein BGO78_15735 [Chloroflexi bacterium 44-23]
MKQLLQNLRDGKAEVVDIPVPKVQAGYVLVRNQASLVSAGTERMVVSFAEKNLVGKVRSRPDLARQVIDKAKREGVVASLSAAFNRLDQPMALGYSSSGIVEQVGENVSGFHRGMRVACAGGGFATHAEFVLIPKNLLVPIPDTLSFEEAAFATLGAISLHGFRLANPQIGDQIAIIGLGLLGMMLGDIAVAAGCSVFGVDLDAERVKLALARGVTAVEREQAEVHAPAFTEGRGFDSVFICADTKSSDPVELAGVIARDKGTVVAIGATGLQIPRKIYYEKELTFLISRSYGPGRYDKEYEELGQDYPYGYVRWTEGRNIGAVVKLMESEKLKVKELISHRFSIEDGVRAYETIKGKENQPFMGVVLFYPPAEGGSSPSSQTKIEMYSVSNKPEASIKLGVLGAGLYAGAVFLPLLDKDRNSEKVAICSAKGLNARHFAKKFHYQYACTDEEQLLRDKEINTVVLLTPHKDHSRQVISALQQKKHVYCEKPLAIDVDSLNKIADEISKAETNLMVGFNRRFSPMIQQVKRFLGDLAEPVHIYYRINAGYLPLNHWLHNPNVGGGRIIGEACHFIDILFYLAGTKPLEVQTFGLPDMGKYHNDNVTMIFKMFDGSVCSIDYLANGDKSVPKEYLEVFTAGKVARLEDFRKLTLTENGQSQVIRSRNRQDKGHQNAWREFINSIHDGTQSPTSFVSIWNVTQASFAAQKSLDQKKPILINSMAD